MSHPIEALENYNINIKDIEKLKSIGINTIQGLYMTSRKDILKIKGFTEKKVINIFNQANKIEVYGLFQKGSDFINERNSTLKISFGFNKLDNMIGGGIESKSITEILGDKNINLSEFAHILSIYAHKNSIDNRIIYFDLGNNFSKEKIIKLSRKLHINPNECLKNIILMNDINSYKELMDKLNEICENNFNFKYSLIIIESLTNIFQYLFNETIQINTIENKIDIESKLGQILHILKKIAILYNTAIIILRNIICDNENSKEKNDLIKSDPNIEIILSNECKTRLKFKKIKNNIIKCIILNSPMIPETECKFKLTDDGIIDC